MFPQQFNDEVTQSLKKSTVYAKELNNFHRFVEVYIVL